VKLPADKPHPSSSASALRAQPDQTPEKRIPSGPSDDLPMRGMALHSGAILL